ncbi:esterase/lipase family protein [Yersinia rochesterensis]|uniref:GPI inositol-deacylase PGAP1-like alpha/beta domain-containing protein n=1 Tax=Yersinia rochesterensis TaxID=1604335 RepID=A0A8D4MX63_9GAMM|nr:hypothetical protein [Yersinia rochesterensis]AYD42613.1 hypothetical protein DXZ79_01920 [Yersinia rochesterensis]
MAETSEKIIAPPAYDENGRLYYPLIPAASIKNQIAVCYKVPDRAIPVIFLPGVMGSNLKTNSQGESDKLWRLDDTFSPAGWLFTGAKTRKKELDPTKVIVDPAGIVANDLADKGFTSRRMRGWGEVANISYGQFLPWLQNALHDFDQFKQGERTKLIGVSLKTENGGEPLTKEQVALSYKYLFPVHVVGYNWLDNIATSGEMLLKKIDDIVLGYASKGIKCEKVIVVTHSMGGLVARHCSELKNGRNKILGIVHGVMPAMGAASAYRRMKAGMEYSDIKGRLTAEVAGGNSAEMTAVLSQSPGPLQLLPGVEYGLNWLKIKDGEHTYSLPKADPFTEIYTIRGKWWSLCEDYLIDPSNIKLNSAKMDKDWVNYKRMINDKVQPIIEKLSGQYHRNTHAFYGNRTPTHGDLIWQGDTPAIDNWLQKDRARYPIDGRASRPPGDEILTIRTVATPLGGKGWHTGIYQQYTIVPPTVSELGDGTVPLRSSQVPTRYLRSRMSLPVEHEPAYKHTVAQQYTLWAIIQIAQKVTETSLRYI